MLKGDDNNLFGTGVTVIHYEVEGRPLGKSVKGILKWYEREYLRGDMKRFKFRKLNRKFLKDLVKGKIREER